VVEDDERPSSDSDSSANASLSISTRADANCGKQRCSCSICCHLTTNNHCASHDQTAHLKVGPTNVRTLSAGFFQRAICALVGTVPDAPIPTTYQAHSRRRTPLGSQINRHVGFAICIPEPKRHSPWDWPVSKVLDLLSRKLFEMLQAEYSSFASTIAILYLPQPFPCHTASSRLDRLLVVLDQVGRTISAGRGAAFPKRIKRTAQCTTKHDSFLVRSKDECLWLQLQFRLGGSSDQAAR
jgi:hypothetical protein